MELGYEVSMITIQAVLTILIGFGNILVITAYFRNEKLQTTTNWFVVQLAGADLLVALAMPLQIAMFIRDDVVQDLHVCLFRYSFPMSSINGSVLCLLAISVDRYVSVIYPHQYKSVLTAKIQVLGAVFVWVPSAFVIVSVHFLGLDDIRPGDPGKKVCDFLYVLNPDFIKYIVLPVFSALSLAIIALYSRVFHLARRHAAAIASLSEHLSVVSNSRLKNNPRQIHRKNMKISKTAAIVLGMFLFCMVPFFAVTGIQVYTDQIFSKTWMTIRMYTTVLSVLNSALNPLIYACRLEDFRGEFQKILRLKRKVNAVAPQPMRRLDNEPGRNETSSTGCENEPKHAAPVALTSKSKVAFSLTLNSGSVDKAISEV
ncbi:dopamine D2-like receptor [Lingula anatina]|uniref:Dopamine D2-like receptor n=1 Tax=Lingula anatina TaxID=7574 RepID=A0A1S3HTZ3_LINAN|nr:dopamine D2-like receptor [Lingula anatina]|eukprot:XP_013389515.1 dopamine D2-like receptor [Lingula anatina]